MTGSMAVVITGSAGAIGEAICKQMSVDGFFTIGIDLIPSDAADKSIVLDLAETKEVRAVGLAVGAEFEVTALVHNAAIQPIGEAGDTPNEDWIEAFRVNVLAADVLLSGMKANLARNQGSVVAISSVHSRATSGGMTAYATTKAALEGWVRSAALDLGPRVRVNAIAPGAVNTAKLREGFARWDEGDAEDRLRFLRDRTALKVIGEVEQVALAARFLIGEGAQFITGSTLVVDGGATIRLATE